MAVFFIIDDYGVKEYKAKYKLLSAIILLYLYITIVAYPLYLVENTINTNLSDYWDAFYLLNISIATIGYGDFYPITELGRWVVTLTFYIGAGIVGIIVGVISNAVSSKFDNSVQNRELRKQNAEIIQLNAEIIQLLKSR